MEQEKSELEAIERVEEHRISPNSGKSEFILPTAEEEAQVIRKIDYNVLPLTFVLYSLSVLDRSNLGNARLAGLQEDVGLVGNQYAWLGTVFYISCEYGLKNIHAASLADM